MIQYRIYSLYRETYLRMRWGAFVCGNLCADYSLYKIQTARKPQTVLQRPQQVWEAVEQVLHSYRYHGHGWAVEEKTEDGDDAAEKLIATLAFSYKLLGFIKLSYALTVTIKVKESYTMLGGSQVCSWFDEQRPWYWLHPAVTVVKHTNAQLLKSLTVLPLPPEAQPFASEKRRADRLAGVMRSGGGYRRVPVGHGISGADVLVLAGTASSRSLGGL